MISRAGILRRVGCDDHIMLLAWLLAVFLSLSVNLGAKRGLGRHDEHIDPGDLPGLRICEYVFTVLYVSIFIYLFERTQLGCGTLRDMLTRGEVRIRL